MYSGSILRFMRAIFNSFFRISDIAILLCVFIFLWAAIGTRVLPGTNDTSYTSSLYYDWRVNNFSNFEIGSNS